MIQAVEVVSLFNEHFDQQAKSALILSGDVNYTYLITLASGEKVIFQRLSSIFNEKLVDDFVPLVEHLGNCGWEVPQAVSTQDGRSYLTDKTGSVWRCITYIESDQRPETIHMSQFGQLLGALHNDLKKLPYQPTFALPHFHDTAYFLTKLNKIRSDLSDPDHQKMAQEVLNRYKALPNLPDTEKQLIHGDARVDNVLFRDGEPFTFIDFDTLMQGTIWVELGDTVRSFAEEEKTPADIKQFSDGYFDRVNLSISADKFHEYVLLAGQYIALELAARFLIDIVEDFYFVWENTPYKSRRAHNEARAKQQLDIQERFAHE